MKETSVHILLGGREAWHRRLLERAIRTKGKAYWTGLSKIEKGDHVLFYFIGDEGGITAEGTAARDAYRRKDGDIRTDCENIRLLPAVVTRESLLTKIPDWGWPKSPRRDTTVSPQIANKLLRLVRSKNKPTKTDSTSTPEERGFSRSAGFGDPLTNKKVEQAAVRAAKRHLEKQGYTVRSREKDCCGYDLYATKGKAELCVEVKGSQGGGEGFIITTNEVAQAKADPRFRLCLVPRALGPRPKPKLIRGKQFLTQFALAPLAYKASLR